MKFQLKKHFNYYSVHNDNPCLHYNYDDNDENEDAYDETGWFQLSWD